MILVPSRASWLCGRSSNLGAVPTGERALVSLPGLRTSLLGSEGDEAPDALPGLESSPATLLNLPGPLDACASAPTPTGDWGFTDCMELVLELGLGPGLEPGAGLAVEAFSRDSPLLVPSSLGFSVCVGLGDVTVLLHPSVLISVPSFVSLLTGPLLETFLLSGTSVLGLLDCWSPGRPLLVWLPDWASPVFGIGLTSGVPRGLHRWKHFRQGYCDTSSVYIQKTFHNIFSGLPRVGSVLLVSLKRTYVLDSVSEPAMKNKPIYKGMPSMQDKKAPLHCPHTDSKK